VLKTRIVCNFDNRNAPLRILRDQRIIGLINLGGQQLQQRLHAVEQSVSVGSFYINITFPNRQMIPFLAVAWWLLCINVEADKLCRISFAGLGDNCYVITGGSIDSLFELESNIFNAVLVCVSHDGGMFADGEAYLTDVH